MNKIIDSIESVVFDCCFAEKIVQQIEDDVINMPAAHGYQSNQMGFPIIIQNK